MGKKKNTKRNGQEFEPDYQFWHENDFSSDEQVAYGMDWIQRHLYRTLLQKAFHCSTRPYLPASDDQLWLLADAGTKDNWLKNKDAIMVKFQLVEIKGIQYFAHKRLLRDWALLVEHHDKKVKAGRDGGRAKAKSRSMDFNPEPVESTDQIEADESAV